MKSYWETYKGKRILFARYDHLALDEYRAEIEAVEEVVLQQPKNSVLLVVDTTGIIISPEALKLAKNTALHCRPYIRKTAILGMTGARKAILEIVVKFSGNPVAAFETVERAKDYLVS